MRKYFVFIAIYAAGFVWSAIQPKDYTIWMLEALPTLVGLLILIFTFKNYRFTDITYIVMLVTCYAMFFGGHYSFAEVPLFTWLDELLGSDRNNFDRIGHFAQGLVPAMIMREGYIRLKVVNGRRWLFFKVLASSLGISAFYELIEWQLAVLFTQSADALVGSQGDFWDTQKDMLCAAGGALFGLKVLNKVQDSQIATIQSSLPGAAVQSQQQPRA